MMEIKLLKQEYFNLPDDTGLKDALDVLINLQAETQELEVRIQIILSQFKKTTSTNDNEIIKNEIKLLDLCLCPPSVENFKSSNCLKVNL
ncbi:hypothetical protein TNIN_374871 [Trichonephila inaurata madagascariensis]|uniref:Uncharacterized protein n=1 Tax=Trichonephila inaurata madagascariensis TaxID=2747483 RepID=A0A8X6YTU1_9ARAC|nr:hypothetical protein TNIN_374871 [Trichonephila inaurata madagascariensis]